MPRASDDAEVRAPEAEGARLRGDRAQRHAPSARRHAARSAEDPRLRQSAELTVQAHARHAPHPTLRRRERRPRQRGGDAGPSQLALLEGLNDVSTRAWSRSARIGGAYRRDPAMGHRDRARKIARRNTRVTADRLSPPWRRCYGKIRVLLVKTSRRSCSRSLSIGREQWRKVAGERRSRRRASPHDRPAHRRTAPRHGEHGAEAASQGGPQRRRARARERPHCGASTRMRKGTVGGPSVRHGGSRSARDRGPTLRICLHPSRCRDQGADGRKSSGLPEISGRTRSRRPA